MPAIGAINVAGDGHGELAGGRLNVVGQRRIVRRPVDKVDQVDAEVGGVGIDGSPLEVELLALVEGGIGGRLNELDGRDERRREGSESKKLHLEKKNQKNQIVIAGKVVVRNVRSDGTADMGKRVTAAG